MQGTKQFSVRSLSMSEMLDFLERAGSVGDTPSPPSSAVTRGTASDTLAVFGFFFFFLGLAEPVLAVCLS